MAAEATRWVDRHMSVIAFVCIAGTCICLVGLGVLQVQLRGEAARGDAARERQQRVFPVSVKVYEDAWRRGVISARELRCFRESKMCPAPSP